jgi:uncharacterized membrane protein YkoI
MRVTRVNPQERKAKMQINIKRLAAGFILCAGPAAIMAGCASMKTGEQDVTLAQASEPARATISKEVGSGHVDKISKEVERGKTVYDVEATVDGKHMEYLIAEKDGELLGTEVPIEFNQLPDPVRAATEKYFGTSTDLTIMKGVEYGETHYEIEGMKKGKKVEVTFDPEGRKGK